ncbi:hypothetical protein [Hyphococcus sp. DH-69]|uniref:hypothetical protein n=1 Tax=Hyphococcus formosus TaxID=3143534 RepID=UPI00398B7A5C
MPSDKKKEPPRFRCTLYEGLEIAPTLDDYLEFIDHPERLGNKLIGVSLFERVCLIQEDLERFGIDILDFMGAIDGDIESIDTVCITIARLLQRRSESARAGRTHLQSRKEEVSDSFVNYCIQIILTTIHSQGESIPDSLFAIIREQLCPSGNAYDKSLLKKARKSAALFTAIDMINCGVTPSVRSITRALEVEPSTILRLFPNDDIIEEAQKLAPIQKDLDNFAREWRNKK